MTGRYPMRDGLQTLVIFPSHTYGLPTDERTLPQALREAGYRTLMTGKWHLGHADRKYWPQNRGFDHFYGNVVGEIDYFTRERGGVTDWQRNGTFLREKGYYTSLIGDEAVELIEAQSPINPFFLYFASLAPHAPYQAPQKYLDQYTSIPDRNRRAYAAMITALDGQVGRLVAALGERSCATIRSSFLPAITAAPRAGCSRAVRRARKSATGRSAASSRAPRHRPRTAASAAAKAVCTRAVSAFRPS